MSNSSGVKMRTPARKPRGVQPLPVPGRRGPPPRGRSRESKRPTSPRKIEAGFMFQIRKPAVAPIRAGKNVSPASASRKNDVDDRDPPDETVYAVHEVEGVGEGHDPQHPDGERRRAPSPGASARAPRAGTGEAGPSRDQRLGGGLGPEVQAGEIVGEPDRPDQGRRRRAAATPLRDPQEHHEAGPGPEHDGDPPEPGGRHLVRAAKVGHVERFRPTAKLTSSGIRAPATRKATPPATTAELTAAPARAPSGARPPAPRPPRTGVARSRSLLRALS